MIPGPILRHLDLHDIPYETRLHAHSVTAQEVAQALGVSGRRVAKPVLLDIDGRLWMAVVAAPDRVDLGAVPFALAARDVRLATEEQFAGLFPGCELGAEPPFGRLYGLPMLVDARLADEDRLFVRAGNHSEVIELAWDDFLRLEQPRVLELTPAWPVAPTVSQPGARA